MKITESQGYGDLVIELKDVSAIEEVFESAFRKDISDAASIPPNDFRSINVQKSLSFADRFKISVECNERSQSSHSLHELTELQFRRCNSIELTFRSTLDDKLVFLSIVAGSSYLSKFSLSVSSTERQFVNGFIKSINDIVKNIRPQNTVLNKYLAIFDIPLTILLTLGIFYGWFQVIFPKIAALIPISQNAVHTLKNDQFLIALARHPNAVDAFFKIINFALSLVMAFSFVRVIVHEVKDMYPTIEFDFGPGHLRHEISARKRLYIVLSLVVIPIIVGVVTNAL